MQVKELKENIDKAAQTGDRLFVKGYKNSDGEVADMKVKLLDPSRGPRDLTVESLTKLNSITNPGDFPEGVWDTAMEQLEDSFRKTLTGQHKNRQSTVSYDKPEDHRWALKEGKDELVVVFHVRVMDKVVREESPLPPTNKRELTKAKDYIRDQLPISEYKNQLLLTPSKYESVEVVGG